MKLSDTVAFLCIINLLAFATYGMDKWLAKRGKSRVSERTLLLLAAAGGAVGAFIAMQLFRHKTLHKKFTIGVPLIFLLHIALVLALIYLGVLRV